MVQHVYHRVTLSQSLDEVFVATPDVEIQRAMEAIGAKVLMTSPLHERCTDRIAEAAERLDADIVVNVQGDEPLIRPEMIDLAIMSLARDPALGCVNLVLRIRMLAEFQNPNTIKVLRDLAGDAVYMSREPIPSTRVISFERLMVYKQVCVISFRKPLLMTFRRLEPTPLEQAESIDMLRLIEHGYKIRLVESEWDSQAVDTPEDLTRVEVVMRDDHLFRSYARGPAEARDV